MSNLLNQITIAVSKGEVSFEQVLEAYNLGLTNSLNKPKTPLSKFLSRSNPYNFTNILVFVGSFLIILGIGFYVAILWVSFNLITQLFVSLGIGLIFSYIAIILSFKFPDRITTGLTIITSTIWLIWGIGFSISKFVDGYNMQILTMSIVALFLAYIYKYLFSITSQSLYYLWFASVGSLSFYGFLFYFLRNYIIYNYNSDNFITRFFNLSLVSAATVGSLQLYIDRISVKNNIKSMISLGWFTQFIVAGFIYVTSFNDNLRELSFGLVFVLWYFIASYTNSKILLIFNSIYMYLWLLYTNFRYFGGSDFAFNIAFSGFLLIIISIVTYYISNDIKGSTTPTK